MADSDKTIKHFVFVRFFPYKLPKYKYDIFDPEFLSAQLRLVKRNLFRTLENQTNKNFELVFVMNFKFFDDPKYEFIFSGLKEATTLPLTFIKNDILEAESEAVVSAEMTRLIEDALDKYDFVIQSRLDFDDFIFKNAVEDTQNKVKECAGFLAYGYCKGYVYVRGELYPFDRAYEGRGGGHFSAMQSLIMESSFAKKLPFTEIYDFGHTVFRRRLKEFLEENGEKFSESMFQQNTKDLAYIYFRHKSAVSGKNKQGTASSIFDAEATKKYFEEEFGFRQKLISIK